MRVRARKGLPRIEWEQPDTEETAISEEAEVYVFDDLGASLVANLDFGPGVRLRHVSGGLAHLARELSGRG